MEHGEVVQRHPDTVIILTADTAYNGCRPMNQSVLSGLNLLIDEDSLTAQDMVKRVMARTGCTDERKLLSMTEMILELKKNFSDVTAIGGICGWGIENADKVLLELIGNLKPFCDRFPAYIHAAGEKEENKERSLIRLQMVDYANGRA